MTGLLIFGKSGQVATELARLAPGAHFLSRNDADLTDPAACAAIVRGGDWSGVVNAAAYTAVDKAEDDEETARAVNALAPGAIAQAAAETGIPFLHISTDYVFEGSGTRPWAEDDPTGPLGAYGRTKLEGEQAIAAAGGQFAILRTAWVFSAHGANFVKTMLRLGAERDELRVVADQHGGPTPAADIARACLTMIGAMQADGAKGGIYHFSGRPDVTWADFATEIMARAGLSCRVTGIPSAEYPTPARRPANSRLDCARIARDFGIPRPHWQAGLDKVLKELNA